MGYIILLTSSGQQTNNPMRSLQGNDYMGQTHGCWETRCSGSPARPLCHHVIVLLNLSSTQDTRSRWQNYVWMRQTLLTRGFASSFLPSNSVYYFFETKLLGWAIVKTIFRVGFSMNIWKAFAELHKCPPWLTEVGTELNSLVQQFSTLNVSQAELRDSEQR